MNKQAVWAVAYKDIAGIKNNVQLWLPIVLIPAIFCILIPAGMILAVQYWDINMISNINMIISTLEKLPPGELKQTLLAFDSLEQQIVYFFLVYMFIPFFMIIPLMISSIIAANSFVGEKEGKTLESLLFTPIDVASLFWGKLLSAFIPAMVVTVVAATVYSMVTNLVGLSLFGRWILPQPNWLVMVVWVIPVFSLFAIFLNVYISARVKGFQEAYQFGSLVVLPVLGLFFTQMTGLILIDVPILLLLGAIVLVIDLVLVYATTRKFDRNRLFESQVS